MSVTSEALRPESFAAAAILVLTPVKSSAALMGGAIGRWMRRRHSQPLPTLWLMTDERMGDTLFDAINSLPRGSGIVFRHYSLEKATRRELLSKVTKLARRNRHVLVIGGSSHGRHPGAVTAQVHTIPERVAAERAGALLLFVSPVFATRSHPGGRPLGRSRFGLMVRGARCPVIALGGMTRRRARSLKILGIYGWAAIDGLTP